MRISLKHLLTALLVVLFSNCASHAQYLGQPAVSQPVAEGLPSFPNAGPPNQSFSGQFGLSPSGMPLFLPGGKNPIGQPGPSLILRPSYSAPAPLALPSGQRSINEPGLSGWLPTGSIGNTTSQGIPLFLNADVRRALNLTENQVSRLREAQKQARSLYKNQYGRLTKLNGADKLTGLQELQVNEQEEFFRTAEGILSAEQMRRYRQLDYQYQGPGAFSNPALRKKLQLTDVQTMQLQALQTQSMYAFASLLQDSRGFPGEALARFNVYRRQLAEKTAGVLTPEQQRLWEELTGEPFKFRYSFSSAITSAKNW